MYRHSTRPAGTPGSLYCWSWVQAVWRQFDYDSFHADLCRSEMVCNPSSSRSVTESFDRYDTTLHSLLNVHAPVKTVSIRAAKPLHGMMMIVGVKREKLVVLRNSTVAQRQKSMKNYGQFSPNINDSSFNRNSATTGPQQLIRAEVTRRLFGPNCRSKCNHLRIKTQAISLPTTSLHSSRWRSIRSELQRRALHQETASRYTVVQFWAHQCWWGCPAAV